MADYNLNVNDQGENILQLFKGYRYDFVLQVPVVSLPNPNAVETEGVVNGWNYKITYRSTQRQAVYTSLYESSDIKYYLLFLNVHFDGTKVLSDLVLDMSLKPTELKVPNLVYMRDLFANVDYNTVSGFNVIVSKVVPWYVQAGDWLASIPAGIKSWFAHLRSGIDAQGQRSVEFLNNYLGDPAKHAAVTVWDVIVKIFVTIWNVIYDIGYFIVEAWPLWVGIGIVYLILEVKKWRSNKRITKSLTRSQRLMEMREQAEANKLEKAAAAKERQLKAEEEHQKKMQALEEKHARKMKVINNPRAGKKKKTPAKPLNPEETVLPL